MLRQFKVQSAYIQTCVYFLQHLVGRLPKFQQEDAVVVKYPCKGGKVFDIYKGTVNFKPSTQSTRLASNEFTDKPGITGSSASPDHLGCALKRKRRLTDVPGLAGLFSKEPACNTNPYQHVPMLDLSMPQLNLCRTPPSSNPYLHPLHNQNEQILLQQAPLDMWLTLSAVN